MQLEERIAALEARHAISELRSRYCWYTVRGERESVLALFTDDCVFENARSEPPVALYGKAALREYLARMRPARRVPLVMNEVTTIAGERADGTCAMVSMGDDSFAGHYVDDFVRVDGRWLFQRRQFHPYWPVYRPSAERPHP
jgi:ketosteroid isomerase-like protein